MRLVEQCRNERKDLVVHHPLPSKPTLSLFSIHHYFLAFNKSLYHKFVQKQQSRKYVSFEVLLIIIYTILAHVNVFIINILLLFCHVFATQRLVVSRCFPIPAFQPVYMASGAFALVKQ